MHADHWHFDVGQGWSQVARRQSEHLRRRPCPHRHDDLPGRQLARLVSRQTVHAELLRSPRKSGNPRAERLRLRRQARQTTACSSATAGFAASTSATAPTAACTSSTGATPANATKTPASIEPPAESTRSPTANRNRQRSATWRSWESATWSSSTFTRTNGTCGKRANNWPSERQPAPTSTKRARSCVHCLTSKRIPCSNFAPCVRLYVIGGADETFLRAQLHHPDEHIRVWAIRFLSDTWPLDTVDVRTSRPLADTHRPRLLEEFVQVAKIDPSNLVHLAFASTLQRLPVSQRVELAAPLVARSANAQDHNLPLLIWYGLIPVGKEDPTSLANLAANCQLPLTRKFIARRLAKTSRAIRPRSTRC